MKCERDRSKLSKYALTVAMFCVVAWALPAAAVGRLANVDVIDRIDGRVLPVYAKDGRYWVEGIPGREYALVVRNASGGRMLAVTSVDGVNVVSGETASPAQSGYVLDPWNSVEIAGWRKSLGRIAAFYFTDLPDAYATRTGRPENVGVIGVALFRERPQPIAYKDRLQGKVAADAPPAESSRTAAESGAGTSAPSPAAEPADSRARNEDSAKRMLAPAPMQAPSLGTGHGRSEESRAQMVRFERESTVPAETIVIHYDRRENLLAMGVLPPPVIARVPLPFPAWQRFAPDPPNR